jgi:RNA polymerase sigma factor (TIGR02999 family)
MSSHQPSSGRDGQTISALLSAAEQGDTDAGSALFAALYTELHRMARRELARRGTAVTIGVTTLLHEAYLDIASREGRSFPDRPRFMAYASRVMRGVIIDHARRRQAIKRGGGFELTTLDTAVNDEFAEERALTEISDALDVLSQQEPSLAEIVDLKFFCGFSFPEIATLRGVSERTVQRQWEKARIFLYRSLRVDSLG